MWLKDGDPQKIITYRHCRVVFGMSCSPFLLAAVLNHVLDQVEEPLKSLAVKIKDSMYVDNCIASVDSASELEYFRSESQRILKAAKFDLRGYENNYLLEMNEFVQDNSICEKEVSVLGLKWDKQNDTLSCELVKEENNSKPVTKRKILSMAHQLFDPIGFTCPITLIPKLLLQECWKIGISWDSKLPDEIIKRFEKWKEELKELSNFKISRRLSNLNLSKSSLTLHIFCDASMVAYPTCIFLRAERNRKVTCQLIQERSRVAPLKKVSIPRLELLACNIGARLADTVKKDLRLEDIETFFWSDSMDALYWIRKEGPWTIFVSNRVDEIRRLSKASDWKFVPGTQNPADLPSRGCTVKTLLKRQWHEGTSWLKESRENWPNFDRVPDEKIVYAKKKKIILSSSNIKDDEFYNISSYKKIIRITGWIYRFFENFRASSKKTGKLSVEEFIKAELKILKRVQEDSFQGKKLKSLKLLSIFTDANGLVRIKTKIIMREDNENFKVPIILPSDHHVVKSLILHKHQELGHPGVQSLMVALREDYWILKARRTVKKVLKTCITCQRFNVKRPEIPEGILPEDRVKNASIFEVIGVDVAGPLLTKDNKKEIETVLCDCESQLNSRPLTYVSDDPDDLCPLTPNLFLKDTRTSSTTVLDRLKLTDKTELSKRLVYRRRLMTDLRARFRSEYLSQLHHRLTVRKTTYHPKVGDIILIWNDNHKKIHWPLGRILSVYSSKDGLIRRAKVKTKSGILIRPIENLCPLELDEENLNSEDQLPETSKDEPERTSSDIPDSVPATTRVGRVVLPPSRFGQ
ncbi:uncharacterized protein [Parasteatoda tepidariorum]|uniref:uncharacterized protein n=1 Tax=Parasteatoda tepidariorum TaxID=114398 RepID=UPI0039BC46FF